MGARALNDVVTARSIVCDRPSNRNHMSVTRLFTSTAMNLLDHEAGDLASARFLLNDVPATRALLHRVLALSLSITDAPIDDERQPEDLLHGRYLEHIDEFEQFCKDNGIPSLLPSILNPSNLMRQLERNTTYTKKDPRMHAMFMKLAEMLRLHDAHLVGIVTALLHGNRHEIIIDFVETACGKNPSEIAQLVSSQKRIADAYLLSLFNLGKLDCIAALYESLDPATVVGNPYLLEAVLQALLSCHRDQDILALLWQNDCGVYRQTALFVVAAEACKQLCIVLGEEDVAYLLTRTFGSECKTLNNLLALRGISTQ